MIQSGQWVQLNLGLVRQQQQALPNARRLFAALSPQLQAWRTQGHLDWFFFMRKPPDVRLRFFTRQPEVVTAELQTLSRELTTAKVVHSGFFSQYDPETERFGGEAAMALVHEYFDCDTRQWLALDALSQQGQRTLTPECLLSAVLQDLFQQVPGAPAAILDTWTALGNHFAPEGFVPLPAPNLSIASIDSEPDKSLQALHAQVGVDSCEGQLLQAYLTANADLAQGFKILWNQSQLTCSLQQTLSSVGQFTLHRHGFAAEPALSLIRKMIARLDDSRVACKKDF